MSDRGPVIAIDGPAGSGKSTLALGLSRELGLAYLNTGMMYRAVTRRALDEGVAPEDGPRLAQLAREIVFAIGGREPGTLLVDGTPPGEELESGPVEANVSQVSRHPEVRSVMRERQRELGSPGGVVEGRDIGSVVFPDADAKIFLSASLEERVARRAEERGGGDHVGGALVERDALDAGVNPFVPAADAVPIDNTGRSIEEVLIEALAIVRARLDDR